MPGIAAFDLNELFYQNYVTPVLDNIFCLGLALKRNRCNKAFRNLRTVLAEADAFSDPIWWKNREKSRIVRNYLVSEIQSDLIVGSKTREKVALRKALADYALYICAYLSMCWIPTAPEHINSSNDGLELLNQRSQRFMA
jgi:hypothetical protein